MARDPAVLDRDASPDRPRNRLGSVGRRTYLRLAGAATATAALVGGVGASEDDYEVIEARGQTIEVGSGETFENVIIDFTTGQHCEVHALGTDWTIRNVGFRGAHDVDENAMACADTGGNTSVVENVYMGDGAVRPDDYRTHGQIAIWVHRDHNGRLEVRNCNFQEWPNNAVYGSAPGGNGDGSVHIENCYAANNDVSSYRLAHGEVIDSVAELTSDGFDGRCVWAWPGSGDIVVDGCDFVTNGRHYAVEAREGVSDVTVSNTSFDTDFHGGYRRDISFGENVDHDPSAYVPDGVPESPEAAAGAETDDGEEDDGWDRRFVYEFVGDGEPTEYYFEVEGAPIERSTFNGASIDEEYTWISEDGTMAAGRVVDGHHAWEFDELLVDVTVEGDAEVLIDERESNLDRYPLEGATGDDWKDDMPWHEDDDERDLLVVDGLGTAGSTRYEVAVSGEIEPTTDEGATIDDAAHIESGHVTGSVAGWRDAFRFDGDLELVTVDGPATVTVNGAAIDPDEYGEAAPHVLTVVSEDGTTYEASVDGSIDPVTWDDAAAEAEVVSERTVEGTIESGVHRHSFSGTLADFTVLDGSATVFVDQEEIDPDEYTEGAVLPHAIVFDGSGTDGVSEYSFEVDGDVVRSSYRDATIDDGDISDGQAVTGSVDDDLDAYWFEGNVVGLHVDGDATVDVEYDIHDG